MARSHISKLLAVFVLLGNLCWAGSWPVAAHSWGGSSTDSSDAVAIDALGNAYVAGTTTSFGAGQGDALILKYDASGTLLWSKTWGGSGDEYGASIKLGPDGYLYLTGGTSSFGAGWYDLFLVKLDTDGNVIWGTTWGGGSFDGGHDIGFDASGNIYVVGESYSTSPCCSAILLKFSTSGILLNQTFYKGPATYDSGYSLTVDANFNVIVAGISWDYSTNPNHNSVLLLKYDSNGNLLWQQNWVTPFPGQDESWAFHAVTTDNANNIYVAGRHSSSCQNSNFGLCDFDSLLLKLDSNGAFQWAKTWGTTGTYDTAGSVVLNSAQAPSVSGILNVFGTPSLFLIGYDINGNLISQSSWQHGSVDSSTAAMAFDSAGVAYVASAALNNQGAWGTTLTNGGTLSGTLIVNSYSTGLPNLTTNSLTTPTASQTSGVQDIGGGGSDAFVTHFVSPVASGMDVSASEGDVPNVVWKNAQSSGIQVVVVDAWGGGAQGRCTKDQLVGDGGIADGCTKSPTGTKGAQGIGLATGAYAVLNYLYRSNEDNSGTYQVGQAVSAVGSGFANLKFLAIDVEQCCGEFIERQPSHQYKKGDEITDPQSHIQEVVKGGISGSSSTLQWNDSGGKTTDGSIIWQDTGYTVIDPAQRLERVCEALAAVPNGIKAAIYTFRPFWQNSIGTGECSNGVDLSQVRLWDVEHGRVFKAQDGNEYCGDGLVSLGAFVTFGPWTSRSGDQFIWSNAVLNGKQWTCPGTQMFFGIPADLDTFSADLLQ